MPSFSSARATRSPPLGMTPLAKKPSDASSRTTSSSMPPGPASQWAELAPELLTTMSFCGGIARLHLQFPEVERLFADTPASFIPTFDAYPRDGPPEAAIDDETLVQLLTL